MLSWLLSWLCVFGISAAMCSYNSCAYTVSFHSLLAPPNSIYITLTPFVSILATPDSFRPDQPLAGDMQIQPPHISESNNEKTV